MLKTYEKSSGNIFGLWNIPIIVFSFFVAYYIRFNPISLKVLDLPSQYLALLFVYLFIWLILSSRFHLYRTKRVTNLRHEVWDVIKATSLCLLIATIPAFFFNEHPLSRLFLGYFWLIDVASLIAFRFIVHTGLKYKTRQRNGCRHILIVGRNDRATKIAKQVERVPEFGVRVLGFIDAPHCKESYYRSQGINLKGDLNDLEKILKEQVVDEVFVTLPFKSFYSEIEKIVHLCENAGVEVKIPADLLNVSLAKLTISNIEEIPSINLYTGPEMDWRLTAKRIADVIVSLVLLILLSPLFAVISILI